MPRYSSPAFMPGPLAQNGETLLVLQHWKSGSTLDEIAARVDRSRETVLRRVMHATRLGRAEVLRLDAIRRAESETAQ